MVYSVGQVQVARFIDEVSPELCAALVESIADVLEEDQAENDVFVLGRVHAGAQLVGRGPKRSLEVLIQASSSKGWLRGP